MTPTIVCDAATLRWVGREIEASLDEARGALVRYVEGEHDPQLVEACLDRLRQVRGTLLLIELHGAAMFTEELELVARMLPTTRGDRTAQAGEALMSGLVALPDYLGELRNGAPDVPVSLLALMNDLRAVRDAPLLSETSLFAPGLDRLVDAGVDLPGSPSDDMAAAVHQTRREFHHGLLGWFGNGGEAALDKLVDVVADWQEAAGTSRVARLFEAAGTVVEGVREGAIEGSVAVKRLVGTLDRVLKRILEHGEADIVEDYPFDLLKNLLYYIATTADTATPAIRELKTRYHLAVPLPSDSGTLQDASLLGLSSDTYNTVRGLLLNELTAIKDRLDVAVHADPTNPEALRQLTPLLHKLSDTFGMLGLGTLRHRLLAQVEGFERTVTDGGLPDEASLMALAGDLVFAESSLEGGILRRSYDSALGLVQAEEATGLTPGELQRYREAVLAEVGDEFTFVKHAVSAFVAAPQHVEAVREVPRHLRLASGALRLLELDVAAHLADQVATRFDRLLEEGPEAPEELPVEPLADAISGLEYYVELTSLCDANADSVLDFAAQALDRIAVAEAAFAELPVAGPGDVEEAVEEAEALPSAEPAAADEGFVPEETDAEIHGIFIEEARDQLDNIRTAYARWRADPDDQEALAILRRGFHTLKGSGRMVGARDIGEFAWAVENLLNRVIDGTFPVSGDIYRFLDEVLEVAPELVEAEAQRRTPDVESLPLEVRAFTLVGEPLPERLQGVAPAAVIESAAPFAAGGEVRDAGAEQVAGEEALVQGPPDTVPEPLEGVAQEAVEETLPEAAEVPEAPDIAAQGLEETAEAPVPEIPPPFALDPVLADIFVAEATNHLRDVDGFLASLDTGVISGEVSDAVTRAFHTLHGSSDMAGIVAIAGLSTAAEALLKQLREHGRRVDTPTASLLKKTGEMIRGIVGAINRPDAVVPEWQALCEELRGLASGVEDTAGEHAPKLRPVEEAAEAVPAPAPSAQAAEVPPPSAKTMPEHAPALAAQEPVADAEVVQIFIEEARELFEQMEGGYSRWQSGDTAAVADLKRVLHTLKGGARLAGIPQIGDLSHALESMLNDMPAGDEPDGTYLKLARQASDRLMEQGDQLASGRQVQAFADLVARLESPGEAAAEPAPPPEVGEMPAPARIEPEISPEPVAPARPLRKVALRPPAAPPARKPVTVREGDRIRMSTDMLDRMVDNVGEVSIYAARLSQQQHVTQFNLKEFEQTIDRLRGQLRRMEIETEAQIRYRYEREGGDTAKESPDFDPLELDRFSTIQELSRLLAETVDDLGSIRELLQSNSRDAETLLLQQSRIVTDLQNSLLRTRLVSFTQQVSRLERLVRQTCAPLGKKARLEVDGRETELDRSVLEQTMPLLEHLLRNAVSHGIETPDKRRAAGKPEEGTVTLGLARDGMDVVLSVADDGQGLDAEAIRAKALERGVLEPDEQLAEEDVIRLILSPGFSTAGQVTQISGRGVGLDVVNSEVKQLGGNLDIESAEGKGSTFTVRLPFSLAITDALLVQIGEEVYAVPHSTVESVVRLPYEKLAACIDGGQPGFEYAGHVYPVVYAGQLFGQNMPSFSDQGKWFPALLVRSGDRRLALHVDSLLGTRQIVVKSLGPQLSVVPWILGGTILGDGRVALIVDMATLVRTAAAELEERAQLEEAPLRRLTVMVVDDSITVRKVTTRVLERHNMNVVTAKDGVEAVELLQETRPDVMLLDIEMPRMDGFEVARRVRNRAETAQVPIIMITSRTGDKHRERALAIGVERYLGKPYQEDELVDTIFEVLAGVSG